MSLIAMSQAVSWVLLTGLGLTVLALSRQIGALHERIAPVGALVTGGGPKVGDRAPLLLGRRLEGGTLAIGGVLAAGASRLLLFVAADCAVCTQVIPLARSVAARERIELVFVGDGLVAEQLALVARFRLGGFVFLNGPELGLEFQIGQLPYAVLLDDMGRLAAKGLVNTREHLESLVTAKATGFGSVQDYLRVS